MGRCVCGAYFFKYSPKPDLILPTIDGHIVEGGRQGEECMTPSGRHKECRTIGPREVCTPNVSIFLCLGSGAWNLSPGYLSEYTTSRNDIQSYLLSVPDRTLTISSPGYLLEQGRKSETPKCQWRESERRVICSPIKLRIAES